MSRRPLSLLALPLLTAAVLLSACEEGSGKADTGASSASDGGDGGEDGDGTDGGTDGGETGDEGGTDGGGTGDDGGMGDGGEAGDDGGMGVGGEAGGDDGTDDGGEAGGDDGEEPPPIPLPMEGTWSLASTSLVRDDCSVATFVDPATFVPETYVIAHTSTDTFTMAADGGDPGGCENTGGYDFGCDSAVVRQDLGDFGFDAEMVIDNAYAGTIGEGLVSMEGTNALSITCEGDCTLIEFVLAFPCAVELDMRLEL